MDVIRDLYLHEELTRKEADKIIKKVKRRKSKGTCWFLILREDSKNLLEIVATDELKRMMKRHNNITILGLAKDEIKARLLVRKLIDDVYQATSSVDINSFFAGNLSS